jgi:hypothetical protein
MNIEVMRQALEALDSDSPDIQLRAATALRAAIEQADKPVAWRWKALVNGEFVSNWVLTHSEPPPYATESMPLYTAPRQEQYDQTSLELCKECGWRAMIPGEGCLTCARQKAKPVAWRWKEVKGEFVGDWVLTEIEPPPYVSESMPLYTAPRQWVELTDEDIHNLPMYQETREMYQLARAIEAKLKEKNT